MEGRPEIQTESQIHVRVWGMDADARPFSQNAVVINNAVGQSAHLLGITHAGVRAYLQTTLGRVFEVIGAVEDGKQAVDAALRLDPDVLVLDISMPAMNGFTSSGPKVQGQDSNPDDV